MADLFQTNGGLRPARGLCLTCRGITCFDIDASKDAPAGEDPLCVSETGRLAHFCEEHRPRLFRVHREDESLETRLKAWQERFK